MTPSNERRGGDFRGKSRSPRTPPPPSRTEKIPLYRVLTC
ncbi:DNase [Salmonella enterica subsp. enterica]|nr:DNase [Salmonella enterica subsp. enterica]